MADAIELVDEEDQEWHKPGFAVTEMSSANWCMDIIIEAENTIEDRRNTAQKEYAKLEKKRSRVDAWLEKEVEQQNQSIAAMKAFLEPWVRANITDKKRSIKLPFGRVGFRKTKGRKEILDAIAALAWAEENAKAAVVTKKHVGITELNEWIETRSTETGEVPELPPSIKVVEPEDKFYVETKEV